MKNTNIKNKKLNNAIANNKKVYEENNSAVNQCIDLFDNQIQNVNDIILQMEKIQKDMEWDKMCAIEHKIDLLNDKMDLILKKLGE